MIVRCFDIQWDRSDTDGKRTKLPKECLIHVDNDMDEDEMLDVLSDKLSDRTGYCHKGFQIEIMA